MQWTIPIIRHVVLEKTKQTRAILSILHSISAHPAIGIPDSGMELSPSENFDGTQNIPACVVSSPAVHYGRVHAPAVGTWPAGDNVLTGRVW